ncbi:MAG: hypothetical protein QM625_22730 [Ralstonia sp.]|uniref:hypothetical protein n=1 Tax=Ralstonia TaxID=48736 RepID=UPI0015CBC241|nr:hypothetical protein [Ralstonia pickettii]MBA9877454.1 hypothetical protein [Ralstonia pickettii]MBA9881706.1 hypothetical protein [Ralstonia pickettii]MBA9887077.1 hypothetical protein [Ralstonia pickettii]MBA9891823.1 hypothetical protein [Ralstonia pickettii]MBA9923637.1 hypothetical protein [Ralstonia pickettii]
MQTYKKLFKAGVATTLAYRGNTFIIQSSDQGNSVEVDFMQNGATMYQLKDVGAGLKARPVLGFDGVVITATVDTNLEFIVSDGDIDIQITQQSVTVSNPGVPVVNGPSALHVSVDGTVNVAGATLTASNVGINNTNANPVPVIDAYTAPVSATWNSGTALNTAQTVNTQGFDTVILTIAPTGTITAGAIAFEVYDGINWIPLKAPRTDSYLTDTVFSLVGASLHSWQLPVAGYPQVRARLSTAIVGSGSASIVSIASSAPDVSLVTVGIDPSQPAIPVQVQPPASAPTDVNPVAVTGVGAALIAANASRKGLRVRNVGPGKLAITAAAATTFANAAVVLQVGDVWNETDAPQAAWYAVSDSSTTANIQTVA